MLWLYSLFLGLRMVLEWVRFFARSWRPRGPVLVLAEGVYSATDPPLMALRRVIPSLRLGGMGLDLSFMLLFFLVMMASRALSSF